MPSKILVADDSTTIQKIVAMAFENEDVEVEGISDGNDALERLTSFSPDVVLADIEMPGMNGIELSKTIKSTPEYNKIRVVLLTSDFEEFEEEEYQESKADDYISKPFKAEDILNKVKALLSGETPSAPVLELSADDLTIEPEESAEGDSGASDNLLELSAEDMVEIEPDDEMQGEAETEPEIEPETEADVELEPVPQTPQITAEDKPQAAYVLTPDDMGEFDETLVPDPADVLPEEPATPSASTQDDMSGDDYLGETLQQTETLDDLDQAFEAVTGKTQTATVAPPEEAASQLNPDTPDLIKESLSFVGETQDQLQEDSRPKTPAASAQSKAQGLEEVMADHAVRILERNMDQAVRQEIAGLSDVIINSVREVIKEVAPDIIRAVIREEIENIRKSE